MKVQEFPLAWRWTDSRYSVLPDTVLSQLRPLGAQEAGLAFERAQSFQRDSGFGKEEGSGSLGLTATGGNGFRDELLKLTSHIPFAGTLPGGTKGSRQKLSIIGIVLKEHVPESVANNLTLVLINAGFDLFLHKFFELLAQGNVHGAKKYIIIIQ